MEFFAYQRAASETARRSAGAIAPMLGLASETGSIVNVCKKYLRDGIDLAANREFLREELGDLLWYAAAVATDAAPRPGRCVAHSPRPPAANRQHLARWRTWAAGSSASTTTRSPEEPDIRP